jgi:hypothetical protein
LRFPDGHQSGQAMVKVIALGDYRNSRAFVAGYSQWRRKFNEPFYAGTRLSDIRPATLNRLAEPGDDSSAALFALIIGFLGFGRDATFESLDSRSQSMVLDINLFMLDQIRFEMMFRLGWLDVFVGNRFPFFDMVIEFQRIKQACQKCPPQLAKGHPGYDAYHLLIDRDKQVYIRRMLPLAMEAFKRAYKL